MIFFPGQNVWGLLSVALLVLAGHALVGQALQRFEYRQPQMGTYFRLVLYAANEDIARRAATAAYERIEGLNQIMSDYLPESELNRLSATAGSGKWVVISEELHEVLSMAQQLAKGSAGAFDVTVGPVVRLWRRARRRQALPDSARLAAAQALVNYRCLRLRKHPWRAKLLRPGMKLDLGGIAKGYAVREALELLRARGIASALVDGGGDIQCSAPPPGRDCWLVKLPETGNLCLHEMAVATSGDQYQYLEIAGIRYSHILDPRTGMPLTGHSLVSVIAPDAALADALASALSVMPPHKGMKWVQQFEGVHVRIMRTEDQHLQFYSTPDFERYLAEVQAKK
ncbi:MAG: FAD:protein FMN transferase [Bacteroidetes bacterium]|nr:MAG: FAD:protein FMN transferase [Bacteroidota bacterium]